MEKTCNLNHYSFPLVKNPRYVEAFSTMFFGTGKMYYNSGNDISRDEVPTGYAIYAFDLTADMCGSSPHFNVTQRGNHTVNTKFSAAPTIAVSLVCYGEFENLIQIYGRRSVAYDYTG